MKLLSCIVEGKGEVLAVPNLCNRILGHLGAYDWRVDSDVFRLPRGKMVDERTPSPLRPCRQGDVRRALERLRRQGASGVLLLCDADDDCPATWARSANEVSGPTLPCTAVMAVREYETWLLLSHSPERLREAGVPVPERVRDAKGALGRIIPGYLPSTHQLEQTRRLDIPGVRVRSQSFDKLVRSLAALCGVEAPPRPS